MRTFDPRLSGLGEREGMKSLRLGTGTAVLGVLAAALLAVASPEVARGLSNCTASQLVPALGGVTVNQGLGN